jgi:TRAP-type mannitol/chloroaromatic compound transport system permease large subunit
MQKKYGFLSFAARVLRIVAWVVLVVGVIGSILFGISTAGATDGAIAGFAGAVAGLFLAIIGSILSFLAWVFLLATRELLYLAIDVEENTRNTAERVAKETI